MCTDAAHIAYDMMLQEDLGHPLTAALALHACHLHLTHPVTPPASDEAAADAPAEEVGSAIIIYLFFITSKRT